ncbi:MAG TPA: aldose 1-epimerase [Bryobacteraceae bacterium]|nr:aldose 1-epimerase [Bryobacteraceae bacterium]
MTRSALFLLLPLMSQAASYSVQHVVVDGVAVIRLADAAHHAEVSVAPSIGNIAYEMKVNGKNAFYVPFQHLGEFQAKPALCGNPFLAPWANRIDQDAFWANGKKFLLNPDLGNVRRDGNGKPIHGLLTFSSLWKVVSAEADDRSAHVTSRLEFWKYPELMAQFPFAHSIEMTYRLRDGVLEVETRLENHSTEPMPVGIGFHPYFQLHDAPRDQWKVHLAARDHLVLSNLLIPTGERKPVTFADPQPLAGMQFDDVFSGLVRGGDGKARFSVEGRQEKITVVYGPKYTVAVVYAPAGRNFICFEPMSMVTNGFNLAHQGVYHELQSAPAGGEWRESYWIAPTGF